MLMQRLPPRCPARAEPGGPRGHSAGDRQPEHPCGTKNSSTVSRPTQFPKTHSTMLITCAWHMPIYPSIRLSWLLESLATPSSDSPPPSVRRSSKMRNHPLRIFFSDSRTDGASQGHRLG